MEYNKKRKIIVQHRKSGEIYEFNSLREAARGLGYTPQTIKFWADGIFTPRYYRVLSVDKEEK